MKLKYFLWAAYAAWLTGVYMIAGLGWAMLNLGLILFLSVWAANFVATAKERAKKNDNS